MERFKTICITCGDTAQFSLVAAFDTAQNAVVVRFTLHCQRCGKGEVIEEIVPKPDLLPIEADPEVRAAIAEVLDRPQ